MQCWFLTIFVTDILYWHQSLCLPTTICAAWIHVCHTFGAVSIVEHVTLVIPFSCEDRRLTLAEQWPTHNRRIRWPAACSIQAMHPNADVLNTRWKLIWRIITSWTFTVINLCTTLILIRPLSGTRTMCKWHSAGSEVRLLCNLCTHGDHVCFNIERIYRRIKTNRMSRKCS